MASSVPKKVREPVTTLEWVVYALLLIYDALAQAAVYGLAGSMCTGTGMGGNQVLRLCQDSTWLYALSFWLVGYALSLGLSLAVASDRLVRVILTNFLIHAFLVPSALAWNLPYFLTPVR